jgi:hypothetical protein
VGTFLANSSQKTIWKVFQVLGCCRVLSRLKAVQISQQEKNASSLLALFSQIYDVQKFFKKAITNKKPD